MRPSQRNTDALREIRLTRHYTKHAEGSVLVEFGDTKVICTASVDESVPGFLKGKGKGWVDYKYPNPTTNKNQQKSSFLEFYDGLIIGCGIYKEQ